ncbi:hypothetical protein NKR23_g12476, partial [Pleurostoma richardsiae]
MSQQTEKPDHAHHALPLAKPKMEETGNYGIENKAAPDCTFSTPIQDPPSGTAINSQPDGKPIPKLFTPLKVRGMTMQNRIIVSPMCQYSAYEGFMTPWHTTHYGGIVQRGPGLTIIEATAV